MADDQQIAGADLDWTPDPNDPDDDVNRLANRLKREIYFIQHLTDQLNRAGFTDVLAEGKTDTLVIILMFLGPNIPNAIGDVRRAIEQCANIASHQRVQAGFPVLLNGRAVAATLTFIHPG